jgi:ubiquinone/menaquinone biosynthesis C-methylase UbiE
MSIEKTTCEFCGEAESVQLFPGTPGMEEIDPAPFYQYNDPAYGHFSIIRCKKCGLARSDQRDEATTRDLHSRQTHELNKQDIQNQKSTFEQRADLLSRKTIPGGYLLDIGCGMGLFAGEMMRKGWQAVGIDSSDWAASQARDLAPWAQFYVSNVETAIFPASSFDVITFWDGLDHTDSPGKALERLTSWLEPGGLLLFILPDITSIQSKLMGSRWPSLLRQHLWYFSPITIKRLLDEHGYTLVSIQPVRSRYTLKKAAHRLIPSGGIPGLLGHLLNLPGPLGNLSFWFSTGEMLVTARLKFLQ